jgi:ketosteroid isomerase-like protein
MQYLLFLALLQHPAERDIVAVHNQITQAAQRLDADAMFAHISGWGAVDIVQNGVPASRDQALQQMKAGFAGLQKLEYRWKIIYTVNVSPDAALLVAQGESTATTGSGSVVTTPFIQTALYMRMNGAWKMLHAHHSSPR